MKNTLGAGYFLLLWFYVIKVLAGIQGTTVLLALGCRLYFPFLILGK